MQANSSRFPNHLRTRWPRVGSNIAEIPWCFKDELAEQKLSKAMEEGWETWRREIGDPSKANGHSLKLTRWPPIRVKKYPYCYDEQGKWDFRRPNEAVVVSWDTTGTVQGRSTVGYDDNDIAIARHRMVIGDSENTSHTVAHELGKCTPRR